MIYLMLLVAFIGGCATSEEGFIKASTQDTIAAYQEYLNKNPDGANRQAAENRLNMLQEQEQKASEKRREEHAAFVKAKKDATLGAYQDYLKKYTTQFEATNEEDEDTREAVGEFRRLATIAALGSGGLEHTTLRSSNHFPTDLFTVRDLLKAGGLMLLDFSSYTGEGEQSLRVTGSSGNVIGSTRSSIDPSTSVVFYSDPDRRLTFTITVKRPAADTNARTWRHYYISVDVAPGISLPEELQGGKQPIKLGGISLAVVTRGKTKEIYEFGTWPVTKGVNQ